MKCRHSGLGNQSHGRGDDAGGHLDHDARERARASPSSYSADNGIAVTALHSPMLTETPRLFFMHFWANDDAVTLARGLRTALDKMAVATPGRAASR